MKTNITKTRMTVDGGLLFSMEVSVELEVQEKTIITAYRAKEHSLFPGEDWDDGEEARAYDARTGAPRTLSKLGLGDFERGLVFESPSIDDMMTLQMNLNYVEKEFNDTMKTLLEFEEK